MISFLLGFTGQGNSALCWNIMRLILFAFIFLLSGGAIGRPIMLHSLAIRASGFRIRQVYILVTRNGHKLGCNTFSCEDNGVAPSSNISMARFQEMIRNVCPAFTLDGHEKKVGGET
eukprot:sb/3476565/